MNLPALVERLGGKLQGEAKGSFRCPAHDDHRASGTVGVGNDGRLLVHCQAGCEVPAILDHVGLTLKDLYPERERGSRNAPVSTYEYRDERNELLYQVLRYVPKTFKQRRPYEGAWAWGLTEGWYEQKPDGDWVKSKTDGNGRHLPAARRVLYRLPELPAKGATVFVVEGEKDADNLIRLGLNATTALGGAGPGKWKPEYTAQLKGYRVVAIPDNDDVGLKHAQAVAKATAGRVLELPGLGPKEDVSDWLAAGHSADDLMGLLRTPPAITDEQTPETDGHRPLRSRSYLTAVTIIEGNIKGVVGARIELNEMTGMPEIGRRVLRDADESKIRAEIERRFVGGIDKDGKQMGLSLSTGDVHDACVQVAADHSYHSVREYLESLKWDGVERLAYVPELLGAERTELNMALLRRTLISAVARVYKPGCKVDTVLILQGPQGIFKSTFFAVLFGDWFLDTPINLSKVPDCYQTLRKAWGYEWAELETLKRASRSTEVKSFLTSTADTYRPSYGRNAVTVPRSGIIVGTTNETEFLADETGARRFWPIAVTHVDVPAIRAQRDQIWAEARAAYLAGEKWWIDAEEPLAEALRAVHDQFTLRDAWEAMVLAYAKDRVDGVSVADVLAGPLQKHQGQWTRGDEMRVASILRTAGFVRRKTNGFIRWVSP